MGPCLTWGHVVQGPQGRPLEEQRAGGCLRPLQALVLTAHLSFQAADKGSRKRYEPLRQGQAGAHHQPSAPTSPQTEVSLCPWSHTSCALRSVEAPRGLLTNWH